MPNLLDLYRFKLQKIKLKVLFSVGKMNKMKGY